MTSRVCDQHRQRLCADSCITVITATSAGRTGRSLCIARSADLQRQMCWVPLLAHLQLQESWLESYGHTVGTLLVHYARTLIDDWYADPVSTCMPACMYPRPCDCMHPKIQVIYVIHLHAHLRNSCYCTCVDLVATIRM